MDDLLHDVILPVKLTNGNTGRGHKWFNSAKIRRAVESDLFDHRRRPFAKPTRVVVTRILGLRERLWDSSSILRGNWKEIEDALVSLGWWVDDGPKWIVKTEGEQDATNREIGPATRVQVFDASDLKGEGMPRLQRTVRLGAKVMNVSEVTVLDINSVGKVVLEVEPAKDDKGRELRVQIANPENSKLTPCQTTEGV